MVDAVKAQGFEQVTASATRQRVKESTVKVRAGVEDVALELMRQLNLPADRLEIDETQYAARTDIRIILGEDAKPPTIRIVTPSPALLPAAP